MNIASRGSLLQKKKFDRGKSHRAIYDSQSMLEGNSIYDPTRKIFPCLSWEAAAKCSPDIVKSGILMNPIFLISFPISYNGLRRERKNSMHVMDVIGHIPR